MEKYLLLVLMACLYAVPTTSMAADPKSLEDKTLKGALTLTSRAEIKPPGTREVRVMYTKENIPSLGILLYRKDSINWIAAEAAPVKLPYFLPTLVAADGQSLLQYGDNKHRHHPIKMDLYFIDAQGREKGCVVDRYGDKTRLAMAADGHVAVTGPLLKDDKRIEVGLYSATGEARFQTKLAEGRRASIAVPASQGQRVAVITTDSKNYLANRRLELFDGEGKKLAQQEGLGILQKVVAVAKGSLFFIQAKSHFGLMNASDGSLLWTRNQSLRLISPLGAATDPEGKTLFLTVAVWEGKPKARYQWRIEVRDVSTGNELAHFILPDSYPSSQGRVFLNVTGTQVELLAGNERIMLDWRRP